MDDERRSALGRRGFLGAAGSVAALSLLGGANADASGQATGSRGPAAGKASGRRRLGRLDVSSVGLGVLNMSRTYRRARLPDGVLRMSGVEAPPKSCRRAA